MSDENTDPRLEPGIGRSLERTRKSKGLSLREVEQRTRIRSRYLRDLEREDFDVLPAVYVLGSLKTYADFLGLDGAALSGQLKARLTEPDEAEVQDRAPESARENEFEAAPVPAIGFDQLFLGMGVILISILAIMTLAAAVAQGDRSPVSQVDQPSTPEPPSEVALAGNTQEKEEEGSGDNAAENDAAENSAPDNGTSENGEEGPKDPEPPEASKDGEQEENGEASRSSLFGDAEFVPMSPASASADPSSAASNAPASSVRSAASASAAPATARPETVRPEDPASSPASPAAGASPRPVEESPGAAPAPPSNAPAPSPAGPEGGGQPSPPASGAGPIPAEAARMIEDASRLTSPE